MEANCRPIVLTLLGVAWPGSESSGPISSVKALARELSPEFEFRIIARDRPFGAKNAVIENGRWFDLGFAKARYCPPSAFGAVGLREVLRSTPHDILALNGFFDRDFTIPALFMLKLRQVPAKPTILSPRGEFSPGALVIHKTRKIVYLRFASAVGLLRDVWLLATAEHEFEDVRRAFLGSRGILFAPDAPRPIKFGECSSVRGTASTALRLAFLGRVTPVKNLHYALKVLRLVTTEVEFDIYGPIENSSYWAMCKQIIAGMHDNVVVRYLGEITNDTVPEALKNYDLFFFPTRGENFGHAIYEALASGVPVLISDQTIWCDLEHQEAGWSLPLNEPARFAAAIDWYAAVGDDQRTRLRLGARRLAERVLVESDFVNKYRQMLNVLLKRDAS